MIILLVILPVVFIYFSIYNSKKKLTLKPIKVKAKYK
jgi:hypothetical protein